ncbi:MAG: FeoA domain-containing protein [Alphaproteobacteria bacterium]|nr:FeoA domain-containing protein [Alphaproteobacteria bacterium]
MPPSPASRCITALAVGEVALIAAIDRAGLAPDTAQRLCELGFDEGVDVEILHRAPFGGDPIAVRVGNMVVALRCDMAALIEVAA